MKVCYGSLEPPESHKGKKKGHWDPFTSSNSTAHYQHIILFSVTSFKSVFLNTLSTTIFITYLAVLILSNSSNTLWGCSQSNMRVRGRGNSPCPLSRNSVMMAALQGDQGLVRLIWMRVGDIMWLSCSFPNTSSQALTLSWGMLNTCPVVGGSEVRLIPWIQDATLNSMHQNQRKHSSNSRPLTQLMSSSEGWREPIVFNHRAAPFGVTHGADVCHAKSVTGWGSTQILAKRKHCIHKYKSKPFTVYDGKCQIIVLLSLTMTPNTAAQVLKNCPYDIFLSHVLT